MKNICMFLLLSIVTSSAFAGYDEGLAAYKKNDFATALKEWQPLAEAGDTKAQNGLGFLYTNGQGVPQDYAQAVAWYRKAADQGDAFAQMKLGFKYTNGQGVPQDYAQAVAWFRKAADQGDADAQYNLGLMYDKGQGVPQDSAQAAAWYRKSADQGYASAQYNLGVMYYNGQGVPQDSAQAAAWFRKSADQGYASAQYNLGVMYDIGQGVPQDSAQAAAWYRKSADQGDATAQNNLGYMYDNGLGVTQDLAKAMQLYTLAAKGGNEEAKRNLVVLQEKQKCLKNASTFLFNQALLCTTKESLRLATRNAGASPTREDDDYWYDQYDSSSVLEGTSNLSIAYIKGKFAKAFYQYDSGMDTQKVVEVRNMVVSKYGKPATSSGNASLGPVTYTWKLKDGIQLKVNREWPDTTVYLTYIHPANFAAMEAEQARLKQAEENEKRSKQSKAF